MCVKYDTNDFTKKSSLNVHLRAHIGEKSHSVEYASKDFSEMWLKNYFRTHSSEKPHICEVCIKDF